MGGRCDGFIASTLLSIACNRLHLVEARLARWLLTTLDRSVEHILPLTHEVIAEMLGVHRPTVTVALQAIEKSGALKVSRGRIEIIDRTILEGIACECYHMAKEQLPAGCGA
jgi:CRP-like cAMP-binding protein